MSQPHDLSALRLADFQPLVGQDFRIRTPDGSFECMMRLDAARDEAHGARPAAIRAPFSLLFDPCESELLAQGIYLVGNDNLAELALFMSPVQGGGDGPRMQSVFG